MGKELRCGISGIYFASSRRSLNLKKLALVQFYPKCNNVPFEVIPLCDFAPPHSTGGKCDGLVGIFLVLDFFRAHCRACQRIIGTLSAIPWSNVDFPLPTFRSAGMPFATRLH